MTYGKIYNCVKALQQLGFAELPSKSLLDIFRAAGRDVRYSPAANRQWLSMRLVSWKHHGLAEAVYGMQDHRRLSGIRLTEKGARLVAGAVDHSDLASKEAHLASLERRIAVLEQGTLRILTGDR